MPNTTVSKTRAPSITVLALSSAALALGACAPAAPSGEAQAEMAAQSEQLAGRFQTQLKQELSTALKEAGATGAIGVCNSAAPVIAKSLSQESGAAVSRIARRNRNSGNGLDAEKEALFAELEAAPVKDGKPNVVQAVVDDRFVWMRAIPMKEQPCSTCHGTDIDPAIQAEIDRLYPQDKAVGFEPGELRGAFLVEHRILK